MSKHKSSLGKRRFKSGGRRFLWVLGILVGLIVLVSGGLITYNLMRGEEVLTPSFDNAKVVFDSNSKLLPGLLLPSVGLNTSRYEVYFFYDLYCPFCAREAVESLGLLVELSKTGKFKVYFVDFPVHLPTSPEVVDSHSILRSLVGFNSMFLEVMYKAYWKFHKESSIPKPSLIHDIIRQYNVKIDDSRIVAEKSQVFKLYSESNKLLSKLLGTQNIGVPAIIIYDTLENKTYHIIGYQKSENIREFFSNIP